MNPNYPDQHKDLEQVKSREALTETIQHRVCEAARLGVNDRFAARYAGIPHRWLRRWLKTGRRVREPYEDSYQQQCALLYAAVEKSRGDYVMNTLYKIEKAGGNHWQALAWKLKQFLTGYHFMNAQNQHQKNKAKKSKRQEKQYDAHQ